MHRGLYQSTRLMYLIASPPAIWQRKIENILKGIPGTTVFLDDIKITAPNDKEHLQRSNVVLDKLAKHNIKVNLNKCKFTENVIENYGYKIDKHGVHKA